MPPHLATAVSRTLAGWHRNPPGTAGCIPDTSPFLAPSAWNYPDRALTPSGSAKGGAGSGSGDGREAEGGQTDGCGGAKHPEVYG